MRHYFISILFVLSFGSLHAQSINYLNGPISCKDSNGNNNCQFATSNNDRYGLSFIGSGSWGGEYSNDTPYEACTVVTYNGAEYVSTEKTQGVIPGTGDSLNLGAHPYDWIYSRSNMDVVIPSQLDCTVFTTLGNAERNIGQGYWSGGNSGKNSTIYLGSNPANYFTNTGLILSDPNPMVNGVSKPNRVSISIVGSNAIETTITKSESYPLPSYSAGVSFPDGVIELPIQSGAYASTYAPKTMQLQNLRVNANNSAPYAIDLEGFALNNLIRNVSGEKGIIGNQRFGIDGSNDSWFMQSEFDNVRSYTGGGGSGAIVSCNSVGGTNPVCTVSAGGGGYDSSTFGILLGNSFGTTAGNSPCSTMGYISVSVSNGVVTGFTPTGFSGCPSVLSAWVWDGQNVNYGLDFENVSDSVFVHPLSTDGKLASMYFKHGNNKIIGAHPYSQGEFGIESSAINSFTDTNCGEQYQGCFYLTSGGTIDDTTFSSSISFPYYSIFTLSSNSLPLDITGLICGFNPLRSATEFHTFSGSNFIWDNYGVNAMSNYANVIDARWCGPNGSGGNINNVPGSMSISGSINIQGNGILGSSGSSVSVDSLYSTVRSQDMASGTATSSTNYSSAAHSYLASYWNGTTAAIDSCTWTQYPSSGTNPLVTLTLQCSGSSGGHEVNLTVPVDIESANLTDKGTCTMVAGSCAAQNLGHTYLATPQCFGSWTGNGTLTGIVKTGSTTTTVTPSSTVGTDTAQINWVCFGK